MAAELEIRFTGDDPEQQAAFDNPSASPGTAPPSSIAAPPAQTPNASPGAAPPAPPAESPDANRRWSVDELLNEIHDILARDTQIVLRDIATSLHEINMRGGGQGQPQQPSGNDPPDDPNQAPQRGGIRGAASRLGRNLAQRASRTRIGRAAIGAGRATQAALARAGIGGATTAATGTGAAATTAAGGTGTAAAGAGLAAALGPVGIAAGAAAVAFTATALTVRALSNAVHGVAQDLAELSPVIASVNAQHEARQTLAQLDRAERIGPEVAQLEAARFRIQESMYEVQTKILELLLKGAPVLELLLDAANVGVRGIDVIIAAIGDIQAQLSVFDFSDDKPARDKLNDSIAALGAAISEVFGDGGDPNAIDPFLSSILNLQAPAKAPPPNVGGMNP